MSRTGAGPKGDIAKRAFDLTLLCLFTPFVLVLLPVLALLIKLEDGGPVFYRSDRMASATRRFKLIKLRTMRASNSDYGVTGADKSARITKTGAVLRKYRLDEMPQLWNILTGDLSFVGPRPPLPCYVAQFPTLYGRVLATKPGLTGLATLIYHRHEALLLAQGETATQTEAIYMTRCIPRKARLDLIYAKNRAIGLDIWIIGQTFKAVFTKAG